MSKKNDLPIETARMVGGACLCLHVQRAARALARRFDEAFRPLDLTHGQFSLLMALNRPEPPNMARVSDVLAMDRTTLTANLKPLRRRGLATVSVDAADRRGRRLALTAAGRALLVRALPIWRRAHRAIERGLAGADPDRLRADLRAVSKQAV
ncbi:MAG TPA: MarR family winged helix-turn-helix transcriptional regulator [Rhodospirillales bacterium]